MLSITEIWARLRLHIYRLLSRPTGFYNIRYFRFGLPFVLKCSDRQESTEADALRFLNSQFHGTRRLPIPRFYDSLVVGNYTYTLMSKIPGELLIQLAGKMSQEEMDIVCREVKDVLETIWTLNPPPEAQGKVMLSCSGHGLPNPNTFHEGLVGPFDSTFDCYSYLAGYGLNNSHVFAQDCPEDGSVQRTFAADPIVFVHGDLRVYNVVVKDGHLSGIIDWEYSGWLPKHWQVHVMKTAARSPGGKYWRAYWMAVNFGEPSEAAFQLSNKTAIHML